MNKWQIGEKVDAERALELAQYVIGFVEDCFSVEGATDDAGGK